MDLYFEKRRFRRNKRPDKAAVVPVPSTVQPLPFELKPEQASQVMGAEGMPSLFSNFCPEVSFDRFGWFASHLSYHADQIDVDVAHADEGATAHDWRWMWSLATPMHYADCPLYSRLLLGVNEVKRREPIGFSGSS